MNIDTSACQHWVYDINDNGKVDMEGAVNIIILLLLSVKVQFTQYKYRLWHSDLICKMLLQKSGRESKGAGWKGRRGEWVAKGSRGGRPEGIFIYLLIERDVCVYVFVWVVSVFLCITLTYLCHSVAGLGDGHWDEYWMGRWVRWRCQFLWYCVANGNWKSN